LNDIILADVLRSYPVSAGRASAVLTPTKGAITWEVIDAHRSDRHGARQQCRL